MRIPVVVGLVLAAGLLVLAPSAGAQSLLQRRLGPGVRVSVHAQTGQVRFVGTAAGAPIARPRGVPAGASPATVARAFFASYGDAFGIADQARELRVRASDDASVRFQQLQRGVPVLGGELVVNLDSAGNVRSANGETLPATRLSTTPRIDDAAARSTAVSAIAKYHGILASALEAAPPELWIYDSRLLGGPGLDRPELVWRTEVTARGERPLRELVLVDAKGGGVSLHFDQIADAKDRRVCDAGNSARQVPCASPVRTETGGSSSVADVNNAFDLSGRTYDFYFALGRDSLDGAGMPLVSTVRYPIDNAFWDGRQMVFGPGYAAADDVVAHELTHGVTELTSRLFYYYQSGAINESLSDVMGELMDLTDGVGNDAEGVRWLVGEDIPGGAIRNMSDPPAFGEPDRTGSPLYTADPNELDNGGVHTNSGVNNKAASLITDGGAFNGHAVSGLGPDKATRIYYEVNAHLLTSASDYADLFDALQQACANLVGAAGISADDCVQVREAALATEMNLMPANAPATEAPMCPTGWVPVDLFADDLENTASGNWAATVTAPPSAWSYPPPSDRVYATSGTNNLWGADVEATSDSSFAMTSSVALPAGAFMHFRHAYGFEDNSDGRRFDGGVVELSTDGGATWQDAGPLITDNGYNGTLSAGSQNPLAGRDAFTAESNGYISSRLDLASLAGQSVRFRFRIGTDVNTGDVGWFIDDVRIRTCTVPPALTAGPARDTTKPRLKLSGRRRQKARRTISISLTANEAVTATVTSTVSVRRSARAKVKRFRLASVKNRALPALRKATIRLKVSRKTLATIRSALRRRGGKATAKITIRARDGAGNVGTATRTIALRR